MKRLLRLFSALILFLLFISGIIYLRYFHAFCAQELGIAELKSSLDSDGDGIDDYTDIMLGARAYIKTKPHYKSRYYAGGYPDDGCGVCTDVIWQAFAAAGYNLKELVDADIQDAQDVYDIELRDPNIDFRRVRNLNVFFSRHAERLTTLLDDPAQWQPGDIVVFDKHIAICSDKRNRDGLPFIIHHGNPIEGAVEINKLDKMTITAHYRWNG